MPSIPALTRSSLHRHAISRLPETGGDKPDKKRFKACPIGYFNIDIAEVSTAQGKLRLFVAIDRTSRFAFVRLVESALVESAGKIEAAGFLRDLVEAVPRTIHSGVIATETTRGLIQDQASIGMVLGPARCAASASR